MAVTLMRQESTAIFHEVDSAPEYCMIDDLYQEDEAEVLQFLAARPIHTVFMSGLIRDNGLTSPHNRGSFYACRDLQGQLEGVGLLGHATLIEARTEAALSAFARQARNCFNAHLIRGERQTVNRFWKHYARPKQEPRLIWREALLELKERLPPLAPVDDLRRATLDDLDQVLKVNAGLAYEERGMSPLNLDPGGFRCRTARRIEQDRIWVWVQGQRLIFKADVMAETPQATYLEGVYVHPEERMKGYGMRCLAQLSSILFARTESICLTVNQRNQGALAFYAKAGYQFRGEYETIYLPRTLNEG
jgi:ribosomal protein S18 acetylase RimI-like enzyme